MSTARLLSIVAISLATLPLCSNHASAQYGAATAPPEQLQTGFNDITAEQAKQFLAVLAGPEFEGRGTGQVGYMKAAHWVAGRLAEYGLEPAGNGNTYFQMMPITQRVPVMSECKITGPNGLEIPGEGNLGFERYTNDGELNGEVVFVSLFGEDAELPIDVELRDKIIIYTTDEAAFAKTPRLLAQKRVAAAIRMIESQPKSIAQTIFSGRRRRSASVSGTIIAGAAAQLADSCGVAPDWSEKANVIATGNQISIKLQMREQQSGAPNVVALLPGSDPELRDEYVVLGSHLDHLGFRNGTVYPGADDNGSGSTAVLSIAKAMAANPVKPKRSVLFMWFAAEEVGLLGSKYYTEHPILPLDNMTCMFNIDMVGRNEDTGEGDTDADNEGHIHLVGSLRGDNKLHELILEVNQHIGFEFETDMETVWNRSDQINFYNHGVPVAFLFGGFHPDYHQPSDKIGDINYKKIASAARLYYLATHAAADYGRFEPNKAEEEATEE
jgi:hypothetical protein